MMVSSKKYAITMDTAFLKDPIYELLVLDAPFTQPDAPVSPSIFYFNFKFIISTFKTFA